MSIPFASLLFLARDAAGRWVPGIGDPTVGGWVTVVAYAATAYLCFRRSKTIAAAVARHGETSSPDDAKQRARILLRRYFWVLGAVITFLAVNKQLDLQSAITQVGKDLALRYEFYQARRALQRIFIAGLAVGAVVTGLLAALMLRKVLRYVRISLAGLTVLALFVLVRAMSFHNVDLFLGSSFLGMQFNWILELTGIGLVAWGTRTPSR